jgi:hypothetical protein
MLRKNLMSLAVIALAALFPATSWGQVVIGDFAGGSDDGWASNAAGDVILTADNSYDIDGDPVTDVTGDGDGYALNVFDTGGNSFWAIVLDHNDVPALGTLLRDTALPGAPQLLFDVTWVLDEWPDPTPGNLDDNWAKWEKIAVNDNTGWQEFSVSNDPANPGFPGSWDANNFGRNHQRTLTYSLAGNNVDTLGFVQLFIAENYAGTWGANPPGGNGGASFWIDNIRVIPEIPEPSSLCLAGLGMAAVVLRRRRKTA